MEQIVYWNLVDGYSHVWNEAEIASSQGNMSLGENYYYGGLIRFDMTPKPAYYTIKNLFEKKWHTEADFTTDTDGKAKFKGFYGKYSVSIEVNGEVVEKEIDMHKKSRNSFKIVL